VQAIDSTAGDAFNEELRMRLPQIWSRWTPLPTLSEVEELLNLTPDAAK